ncbi:MAG: iron-sulfur cluster carrier protein ApbC [Legionellaceae bacterium]|nr:iron-sulfur cluster carrier protein ApbC [Legionellaceae bacterium]
MGFFYAKLGAMNKTQQQAVPNIQQIIAIASGKGGVGKSTTAVNLALALKAQGKSVGLLDADIYGPNQPQMLGAWQQPEINEQKCFEPVMAHGLQTMSMGYVIERSRAMVWRGPMVGKALQQLLFQTSWQPMDYLIIDLPPGTGDVQLTLAQKVPVDAAIVVTTPQDVALLDARKAIAMFEKVEVPILGVVENMSVYQCPQCGHEAHVFGESGGVHMAAQHNVELLAQLPLALAIREQADHGQPIVIAQPDGEYATRYLGLAQKVIKLMPQPVAPDYLFKG